MNIRRFVARTSRDALTLVRQALGDKAVGAVDQALRRGDVEVASDDGRRGVAPQPRRTDRAVPPKLPGAR